MQNAGDHSESPLATSYHRLRKLVDQMPDLESGDFVEQEINLWLGRAAILISEHASHVSAIQFRLAGVNLDGPLREQSAQTIRHIVAKCLESVAARLEATQKEDAAPTFTALSEAIADAEHDIFIVDRGLEADQLAAIKPLVREGVTVRLLSGNEENPTLVAAAEKWMGEHGDANPLMARTTPRQLLHDRFVAIDHKDLWVLAYSLKSMSASDTPTAALLDDELSQDKLAVYGQMWEKSKSI